MWIIVYKYIGDFSVWFENKSVSIAGQTAANISSDEMEEAMNIAGKENTFLKAGETSELPFSISPRSNDPSIVITKIANAKDK